MAKQTEQTKPAEHTPGPWDIQNKGDLNGQSARLEIVEGVNENGSLDLPTIATMPDLTDLSYQRARLIAAAPAMLDALEILVGDLQHIMSPDLVKHFGAGKCKGMAAIAKATGEATQ